MKILFYSPVQLLSGGGCERWHCDITSSLKKIFGYDIEIVTGNLGQTRWSEEYLKVQLQGIKYTRLQFPLMAGVILPSLSKTIFLYKKFKEADAIHFIYGFMGQDILVALLKFLTGKKVIVGHHAPIYHSSRVHNLYMKYISKFVLRYFDYNQTLNKSDKDYFEKEWDIKNVHFIPSGVKVEKFLKLKKIKHKGLRFISVGRYALQKGIDLQLAAIELFNQKYKSNNTEFHFAGSGELENIIEDYRARNSNIINHGFLKYEDLPKLYASNDIYLLCSREEPFGLVLIEAWASGLPILATKVEGPKDMLKQGINGWFIEAVTEKGIFEGIEKIYLKHFKKEINYAKLSKSCKKTGEIFNIDNTAKTMKEIFLKCT